MKALLHLKSAIAQSPTFGIIALVLLAPVIFPKLAFAAELQTSGQPAQIFEIKITDLSFLNQTPKQTLQNFLSMQDIEDNDPLVISLKQYLKDNDSPLGEYAAEIIKQPQWQRALAISYVESHMGRFCHSNNCSGIGGAPGMKSWRKYPTKLDWFKDMCQLLEKPIYKEKYTTFKKMNGVYVQPGSQNWINGATKKFNDLLAITEQAELDRRELAQIHITNITALATFPENLN
jgi:hypothetical protein